MSNYILAVIQNFQYKAPLKPQDAPHLWARPTYCQATQHTNPKETSPILLPPQISLVQKIIGTFLYNSLVVDPNMLVDLVDMASTQAKATGKTY